MTGSDWAIGHGAAPASCRGLLLQALVLFWARGPMHSFWPLTSPLGGAATPVLFPAGFAVPFGGRGNLFLRLHFWSRRAALGLNSHSSL